MAPTTEIPLDELGIQPFHLWSKRWFLLAAGEYAASAGGAGAAGATGAAGAAASGAAGAAASGAAGGGAGYNFMTVSWGGLGFLWNKPFAMVVVRPTRHTRGFIDHAATFTLSVLPESFRKSLDYAGSHSGREGDKARACGLTPRPSRRVAAPSFEEAELVLECRKSYFSDLDPAHFLDESIASHYAARDYHRVYFGEVLAAFGTPAWTAVRSPG